MRIWWARQTRKSKVLPSLEAVVERSDPTCPLVGAVVRRAPCSLGSGAPTGAGPCVWDRRQVWAPGPRQVSLAAGWTGKWEAGPRDPGPLSEDPWDPQAHHLTSLCFSFPICKMGIALLISLVNWLKTSLLKKTATVTSFHRPGDDWSGSTGQRISFG